MFKLHKPHLSTSNIHSGHFMVSRVDDDEDDNNDAGDDSSESDRDNGQSYEIDVSNPDSAADVAKSLDISYRVQSPSAKSELVTSWNDLDRPAKRPHTKHHYLTYYTNSQHKTSESRRKTSLGIGPSTSAAAAAAAGATATTTAATTTTTTTTTAASAMGATNSGLSTGALSPASAGAASLTPGGGGGGGGGTSRLAGFAGGSTGNNLDSQIDAAIDGRVASLAHHANYHQAALQTNRMRAATAMGGPYAPAGAAGMNLSDLGGQVMSRTATMAASAYLDSDGAANEPRNLSGDAQGQLQMLAQQAGGGETEMGVVIEEEEEGEAANGELEEGDQQPRHAVTIDPSLTKLLESMSLYYSHKLTSPKWKSFKGLKLRMRHKIRLNNLIWRAWFFQCIRGREPPGCQFTAPPESDVHKKSESIVLEGKYWKRKEKAIVDEYKKWRIFHKQRSQIASGQMHYFRPSSFDWDSRVSNWASSSMYGPDYSFYTDDYDVNADYNLDEIAPMAADLEQDTAGYYQASVPVSAGASGQTSSTRMIEAPQQQVTSQQQQQQQQLITQMQVPSRIVESHPHQQQQQHHHHQQQQQQQHQHLHIQHHPALSLKADRTPADMSMQQSANQEQMQQMGSPQALNVSLPSFAQLPHQQQQHPLHLQHHHQQQAVSQQQQQQQQQQHPVGLSQHQREHLNHLQQQQPVPYAFENNAVYQQIQHQPQQLTLSQMQQVQQQQQQDQQSFLNQDLCSISSGASGSGSIISGVGGGRTEQRRVCHINAEQKRRSNIKNGFDTLRSILPTINHNVNVKVSKASMLQKAASYISTLTNEQRQQMEEEAILRQQVESLKQSILAHQAQLPSSGVVGPGATSTTTSRAREMLQDYIRRRTLENWKFWIFSVLIERMYENYHKTVNTSSLEDAFKTMYTWLDQYMNLGTLRKDVTESLTMLSTNTNVLCTPQTLPTEAVEAVRYPSHHQQQQQQQQLLQQQQQQQLQQQQHRPGSNNLNAQIVMPPTPTPSATSMQSNLSTIPAAASSSSAQTPTPPISMTPRSQLQHQQQQQLHQQYQMHQVSNQQVQQASQSLQPHSIRSMW